ncbi:MAG: hypothetical protein R2828_26170 [Saprospiraceae bacterium]
MKRMNPFSFIFLCLLTSAAGQNPYPEQKAIISVERIWDRAEHNAFTDLILFNGKFYCAFREGSGHIPGLNGTIRIIASEDGQNWYSAAHLAEQGVDLRDPKLSITPDGRLMAVIAGSIYEGKQFMRRDPLVFFSDQEGKRFFSPQKIELPPAIVTETDWLWRVTWQAGYGYGVVYQPTDNEWGLQLVRTKNGLEYELVSTLNVYGKPSEATLRFLSDQSMLALVRRDGENTPGYIGHSKPPYDSWTWNSLEVKLGGPDFLRLPDGRWLCATRDYTGEDYKTILAFINPEGKSNKVITLPSGGDTSYPSMVVRDDILYLSYYSGHEGKVAIYLAKIWWERL